MRGGDIRSEALFSYVSWEARVPLDHPLRPIQKIVNEVLAAVTEEFELTLVERLMYQSLRSYWSACESAFDWVLRDCGCADWIFRRFGKRISSELPFDGQG